MRKAAIVGAGEAGGGWAARFLLNGWDVALWDPDPYTHASAEAAIRRATATLPMLYDTALPPEGRLEVCKTVEAALRVADHVQAARPDLSRSDVPYCAAHEPAYLLPFVAVPPQAAATRDTLRGIGMDPIDDLPSHPFPGLPAEAEDRDRILVALLRALKREHAGAGHVIAAHEKTLPLPDPSGRPILALRRVIPSDWTDYNGHMNESRYGQIWSDASDAVLVMAGAGPDYTATGNSFFTAETKTNFLAETHAGEAIRCEIDVTMVEGRKLRLFHRMLRERDGTLLATCDQFLLHVSLETRRSCPPPDAMLALLQSLRETP
jgi:acyl-CoA thioesterase FadM